MQTIIHVMGMRSSKYGGLERFMCSLAKQLKTEQKKLILIYESTPSSQVYVENLYSHGAEIIVLPSRKLSIIKFTLIFSFLLFKKKPSIVHCHFFPASYIALLLSYCFRVDKRFQTIHSMIASRDNKPVYDIAELKKKTIYLKKLMYRTSVELFSVSNEIKSQFGTIFGDTKKIKTIYLGVEQNKFEKFKSRNKYNLPSDVVIISCVAFHDAVKGIDILLEAVSILIKEYKHENILICQIGSGDSTKTEQLKGLAMELSISKYINWMGIQNNVPELLAATDIYCQPSRSEGISLSIMEAAMASLPTVATNVGGIPEAVNDNLTGYLVPSENAVLMAKKLDFLIQNEAVRHQMGQQAKNHSLNNFMLEKQTKRLLEHYK